MRVFVPIVFLLCIVTSITCLWLLVRGWRRTSTRLLFWSALCFAFLAMNNLLVFIDVIVLPTSIDLRPLRLIASLSAVSVLLWGLIWESE